jgi:hypothetical protein
LHRFRFRFRVAFVSLSHRFRIAFASLSHRFRITFASLSHRFRIVSIGTLSRHFNLTIA